MGNQMDVEQILMDTLQKEILVELLAEKGHTLPEEELVSLMKLTKNNPWDAAIVHDIAKAAK
jgi:hypothetical protein